LQTPEELEDAAKYSQVSPAAVMALLLGLASPLALVGPLFFFVPAAAIGVAIVALGKIRQSEGALTGTTLARLAMGLALAFTAAALVRASVRDELLKRQAAETGRRWLGLLADGRIEEARSLLSGDGAGGLLPPRSMDQQPRPQEDQEELILEQLRSDALTRSLAGKEVSLEEVAGLTFDGPKTIVGSSYLIGEAGAAARRRVQLQLVRLTFYEQEGKPWRVDRWSTSEASAATPTSK
jgi:hypothetical protein